MRDWFIIRNKYCYGAGTGLHYICELSSQAAGGRVEPMEASTTFATDDELVPDTARSGRANAIISPSRWYKNPSGYCCPFDSFAGHSLAKFPLTALLPES